MTKLNRGGHKRQRKEAIKKRSLGTYSEVWVVLIRMKMKILM